MKGGSQSMTMIRYVVSKFAMMTLTLFVIITATFFLVNSIPGNPVMAKTLNMQPAVIEKLFEKYGYDKPLPERYLVTLRSLLHGDFGMSTVYEGDTVQNIVRQKLPITAQLGLQQVLLGVPLGLLLGVVAALKNGKRADRLILFFSVLAVSVPQLVLALLLQKFLAGGATGLPIIGWSGFRSTVLPTFAGAFSYTAFYARLLKSSVLDVISQDYVLTAQSKGLSASCVVRRHILRNAFLPVVTYLPTAVVMAVTGSFFIESVFAIPGLGFYYVNSVASRDIPMVLGLTVFFSVLLLLVVFFTDILYKLIDPRIRITGTGER